MGVDRPNRTFQLYSLPESSSHTVDGRNPANQLRVVVYPSIYKVLCIPGGDRRICFHQQYLVGTLLKGQGWGSLFLLKPSSPGMAGGFWKTSASKYSARRIQVRTEGILPINKWVLYFSLSGDSGGKEFFTASATASAMLHTFHIYIYIPWGSKDH